MKPLLLLFFCIAYYAAGAQTTDSVTIVLQPFVATGEDTITWSTDRHLQPGDFGGVLPATKEFKNIATLSAMSIIYSYQPLRGSNTVLVKLGTLFFKSSSKINPDERKGALVVECAQLQFDLEKLYELKLAACLKDTVLQGATFYPSIIAIYNRFHAELIQTMQTMRDECNYANINFISRKKLRRWQDKVAAEISMLSAK